MSVSTKRIVVAGALLGAGYALYWMYKKTIALEGQFSAANLVKTTTGVLTGDVPVIGGGGPTTSGNANTPESGFPLKKGSSGPLVGELQQILISKYGKSILPKYGADEKFGNETEAALKSKFNGLTQVKDRSQLEAIRNYTGTGSTTGVLAGNGTQAPNFLGLIGLK